MSVSQVQTTSAVSKKQTKGRSVIKYYNYSRLDAKESVRVDDFWNYDEKMTSIIDNIRANVFLTIFRNLLKIKFVNFEHFLPQMVA